MKISLDIIEEKIRKFVESSVTMFPIKSIDNLLVSNLGNAMLESVTEDDKGKTFAADSYEICLSSDNMPSEEDQNDLARKLSKGLEETVQDLDISLKAPVTISFSIDKFLEHSSIEVKASRSEFAIDQTSMIPIEAQSANINVIDKVAYLLYEDRIFTIKEPVINIGRDKDNHLVINDKHVSRNHTQIRSTGDHYILFDLNSTSGTYINGKKISRQYLKSGDVITLAKIKLLFGIENSSTLNDTTKHAIDTETKSESQNYP